MRSRSPRDIVWRSLAMEVMNMSDRGVGERYNPQAIEQKWQKRWEETGLYKTVEDPSRPKHYALTMLPYTSGDLHIGHWYAMVPSDAKARFMRMKGYNVFFPIGFDAFGLPAENAAIKRGIPPKEWTLDNVGRMRVQFRSMGAMWAWDREAITCLPAFYKWTEWFFRKFYDLGLAYRKRASVDYCPQCNTTLAREQVWGCLQVVGVDMLAGSNIFGRYPDAGAVFYDGLTFCYGSDSYFMAEGDGIPGRYL